MKYPYEPKSNRKLEVGEFWSIPLSDNCYACGVVLSIPDKEKNRVKFVAGLTNWTNSEEPNEYNLSGQKLQIEKFGEVHIKTLTTKGAKIRGKVSIDLIENYNKIQAEDLKTWGFNFINLLAEELQNTVGEFEDVFSYDWYDGPISGVANWKGNPHYFEYQEYNKIQKNSYYLTPLGKDILKLVKEDWQIWKNWDSAFHKGKTNIETHPFLPKDRKRGEQLKKILNENLKIDSSNFIELKAEFKIKINQENVLGQKEIIVKWKEK